MSKTRLRVTLLLLLVVGGLGAGAWFWRSRSGGAAPDVLVIYGNVDIRQVQLAFNGAERIARMLVQEGDPVRAGQLVAELDTRRLELAAANTASQVESQRQVLARLEAGTRPEDIKKARADFEAAEVEAANAQRNDRRLRDLAARHLASQEQADDARAAADAAAARQRAAAETLALAVAGPRKEDIAAARATLEALRAQLALERRKLADAELYAPASAVVQDRLLEPGDMASPDRPVYTLALADPLWVRAYVSEPDLGKLRPGMAARVTTDSFPGRTYRAWIGFISPTAEFTPKSVETREVRTQLVYQVRVYVCNPRNELRLGMPATVTIPLQQPPAKAGSAATDHCQGS
jgi:HlyD family secretion protein